MRTIQSNDAILVDSTDDAIITKCDDNSNDDDNKQLMVRFYSFFQIDSSIILTFCQIQIEMGNWR